jgi:hypothetical protein
MYGNLRTDWEVVSEVTPITFTISKISGVLPFAAKLSFLEAPGNRWRSLCLGHVPSKNYVLGVVDARLFCNIRTVDPRVIDLIGMKVQAKLGD